MPNTDGTAFVAVEIPTNFCAEVDKAKVIAKAKYPDTIGSVSSGMYVARLVAGSIVSVVGCLREKVLN